MATFTLTNPETGKKVRHAASHAKVWSFMDLLNDEDAKSLVEQIEWSSSDPMITYNLKVEIFKKYGYKYYS